MMLVAPLTHADVAQYRTLMLEAYQHAPDAFTSTPEERAAEAESWWLKRVADPSGATVAFGASVGGELMGAVALEFSAKPKTSHKAHLIGMYVRPEARGAGAGRSLAVAAIEHARARPGVLVMTLTVTQGNAAAEQLYRSVGFQRFGVEPMAIRGQNGYLSKVHMWLALDHAQTPAQSLTPRGEPT